MSASVRIALSTPRRGNATVISVCVPPSQRIRTAAWAASRSTVMTTSLTSSRSNCLRSRIVVVSASNTARRSAPARDSQATSSSVSTAGRRDRLRGEVGLGLAQRDKPCLPVAFQAAGDQPVLRLDRVELAAGPLGRIAGPLDGQLERAHPPGVLVLGLGQAAAVAARAAGCSTMNICWTTAASRRRPLRLWQLRAEPYSRSPCAHRYRGTRPSGPE